MLLTMKKKSALSGEVQTVARDFNLTPDELKGIFKEIKQNNKGDFGQFSAIYVDPDEYVIVGNGRTIDFKPQFWPLAYQNIIQDLMNDLQVS
jgi:hypothetical protein